MLDNLLEAIITILLIGFITITISKILGLNKYFKYLYKLFGKHHIQTIENLKHLYKISVDEGKGRKALSQAKALYLLIHEDDMPEDVIRKIKKNISEHINKIDF